MVATLNLYYSSSLFLKYELVLLLTQIWLLYFNFPPSASSRVPQLSFIHFYFLATPKLNPLLLFPLPLSIVGKLVIKGDDLQILKSLSWLLRSALYYFKLIIIFMFYRATEMLKGGLLQFLEWFLHEFGTWFLFGNYLPFNYIVVSTESRDLVL